MFSRGFDQLWTHSNISMRVSLVDVSFPPHHHWYSRTSFYCITRLHRLHPHVTTFSCSVLSWYFFFFFLKSMTKSSAKIFFLSNRETKPRFLYVSRYLEPLGLITLTEETIRKMNHLRTHQLWTMSFCTASRASLRTLGSLWVIIFITITLHPRFSSTLEIKQVVNQQLQRTMWQAFLVGRRRLGLETIHLFPRITSKICL